MYDQLIIGNRASEDDYGASVKTRKISNPEKKKITRTVPFSNVTYDFTKLNGQIYWNQRELEYELEMIAPNPEVLEDMKIEFSNFVMNVINEDIYDPWILDYHFNGTFESIDFDDDESGEKTTITVKFLAYPYKIANQARKYSNIIEAALNVSVTVQNRSSHRIVPTIKVTGSARIVYGNSSYGLGDGTHESEAFALEIGANSFYLENTGDDTCTVEISFFEEVF